MPFIYRRGRLFLGREGATYGVAADNTAALLGIANGPLGGLATAALGAQANINGLAIPTLDRSLEPQFNKHLSPMQIGRRFEDVAQVPGRRQGQGQFQVEVTPDVIGLLFLLAMGSDVVTPTANGSVTAGTNNANGTTLTLGANSNPAMIDGQALWINDAALSEYVYVSGSVSANATSVPIRAGGGTGGGFKNTHTTGKTVEVGPWSHAFTPSAGSPGSFQAEDNWGGAATSLLYKGLLVDSLEFAAPIESDTDALTAVVKVLGMAPSATAVAASAAPSGMPLEEIPVQAGNTPTLVVTGATSTTIYVPDFKMTIANNIRLAKSQVSAPDPAFAIGTAFSLRGSMDTVFEDYGVYQDFANNAIWAPLTFTWTWPGSLLKVNPSGTPATLVISINRFGIANSGKPTMKEDLVHFPIDEWRALDYSDFSSVATITLKNNVARY